MEILIEDVGRKHPIADEERFNRIFDAALRILEDDYEARAHSHVQDAYGITAAEMSDLQMTLSELDVILDWQAEKTDDEVAHAWAAAMWQALEQQIVARRLERKVSPQPTASEALAHLKALSSSGAASDVFEAEAQAVEESIASGTAMPLHIASVASQRPMLRPDESGKDEETDGASATRQRERPRRRRRLRAERATVATGSEADILNFTTYLELATTTQALATGRFDSAVAFTDPKLARAWELLTWVVTVVANPARRTEIRQASKTWDDIRPSVQGAIAKARHRGFDMAAATAGVERLDKQLVSVEAAALVSAGERSVAFASPEAGLYAEQDAQLGQAFRALRKIISEGDPIVQWNERHLGRGLSSVHVASLTEAQTRYVNLGRTVLGWAALWEDYKSLDARLDQARRQGLLDKNAKLVEFINRATTVVTETANFVTRIFQASSAAKAAAYAAKVAESSTKAAQGGGFMDDAIAELGRKRWQQRADAFGKMRFAVGIAGAVQIISSTLNLIVAIRDEDLRAGVAASHGIVQGGITLGGAAIGAGTAATTLVSGAAAVAWVTIEAIFDIAELSAWGRRQKAIGEIARPLEVAASLIPWGKRMAGVAGALMAIDSNDLNHRAALEERLVKYGTQPFNIVLKGMLGVQTWVQRRPELERVMGPQALSALAQLQHMQFRSPDDPVSPWDIINLSDLCASIFTGLQRVGQWAIAKYGERRTSKEAKNQLLRLEGGEAVNPP